MTYPLKWFMVMIVQEFPNDFFCMVKIKKSHITYGNRILVKLWSTVVLRYTIYYFYKSMWKILYKKQGK